jgi:hypothetical protein
VASLHGRKEDVLEHWLFQLARIAWVDNWSDYTSSGGIGQEERDNSKGSFPVLSVADTPESAKSDRWSKERPRYVISDPALQVASLHGRKEDVLEHLLFQLARIARVDNWSDSYTSSGGIGAERKSVDAFLLGWEDTTRHFKGLSKFLHRRFDSSDVSAELFQKVLTISQRAEETVKDFVARFRSTVQRLLRASLSAFNPRALLQFFFKSLRVDVQKEVV